MKASFGLFITLATGLLATAARFQITPEDASFQDGLASVRVQFFILFVVLIFVVIILTGVALGSSKRQVFTVSTIGSPRTETTLEATRVLTSFFLDLVGAVVETPAGSRNGPK